MADTLAGLSPGEREMVWLVAEGRSWRAAAGLPERAGRNVQRRVRRKIRIVVVRQRERAPRRGALRLTALHQKHPWFSG